MDTLAKGAVYRISGKYRKKQVKNTGGIGNGTTIYRSYAEGSRRQWEAVYGLEIRQGCNGMMAERRKKSTVGRGTTNLFDELCPK